MNAIGERTSDIVFRHFAPPPSLSKYITRLFLTEISIPEDGMVEDVLFPDWTSFHFYRGGNLELDTPVGGETGRTSFSVLGPRTQALRFRTGSLRQWGFNLHPLGWTTLIGAEASKYVNGVFDGHAEPVFAPFRPLAANLFGAVPDTEGELARLIAFLEAIPESAAANEVLLQETFRATRDSQIATVEALAERLGCSKRTLERICKHSFGFTPKVLLARERFLRSLSGFIGDPSAKWIDAIDPRYHDQAHFVRDFHRFMGMTPTEYGEIEKPIVLPALRERERFRREQTRAMSERGDDGLGR